MEDNSENGMVLFVNPEADSMLAPPLCSGNACKFIGVRGNFRPGTNMISSFSLNNSGPDSVVVRLTWGDVLGGCNITSSDVVFPGETIEMFAPGQYNPGYCKITADVQALHEGIVETTGAQCSYDGSTFNDGETTCINDTDHVCRNGRWVRLGTRELAATRPRTIP
jgi:hypothetical protein